MKLFSIVAFFVLTAVTAAGSQDKYVWLFFREDCIDTFFRKFDFFNIGCLKASISKVLGFGIIAGSCIVKLPQILKIRSMGSVDGLDATSNYLELISSILAVVWHLWNGSPFSAYGESITVGLGTVVVVGLMWAYRRPSTGHAVYWLFIMGSCTALTAVSAKQAESFLQHGASTLISTLTGLGVGDAAVWSKALANPSPLNVVQYLGATLFAWSRLSQIAANIMQGSTGPLAPLTLLMNFSGTCARVFTSSQEVNDSVQLAASIINAALNGALVAQYVQYNLFASKPAAAAAKIEAKKVK